MSLSTWNSYPGGSHIGLIYIYVSAFWGAFFVKFGYSDRWVFLRDKGAQIKKWVYFEQNIVKSTQFAQNWVFFYQKCNTDGWVIGLKIGMYRESQIFEVQQAHPHTILAKVPPPPPGIHTPCIRCFSSMGGVCNSNEVVQFLVSWRKKFISYLSSKIFCHTKNSL